MKRTAEFTLGLIGGILGIITSAFTIFGAGFVPLATKAIENTVTATMGSNVIGLAAGIVGLIFACKVNKNSKTSGIVMIICGMVIFLTNFFQIIPLVLFLIAGIMCLARKVEKVEN